MGEVGHPPVRRGAEEEGDPVMKWPYILQQIVVLGAWCWAARVIWSEVRGLMEDLERG